MSDLCRELGRSNSLPNISDRGTVYRAGSRGHARYRAHYKMVLHVTKGIDRYDPRIEKGSYRGLYEGLRREFLRNEACLAS